MQAAAGLAAATASSSVRCWTASWACDRKCSKAWHCDCLNSLPSPVRLYSLPVRLLRLFAGHTSGRTSAGLPMHHHLTARVSRELACRAVAFQVCTLACCTAL